MGPGHRVDTATPEGMYVYTVMSAGAALELQILKRRTREGLAAARKRGKRLGRPPKLTSDHIESARLALSDRSETLTSLARQFAVTPWTLSRALRQPKTRPE